MTDATHATDATRLEPDTIADAASVALDHEPVSPDQVVAGSPTTAAT